MTVLSAWKWPEKISLTLASLKDSSLGSLYALA
jgi:hypothetical protein